MPKYLFFAFLMVGVLFIFYGGCPFYFSFLFFFILGIYAVHGCI